MTNKHILMLCHPTYHAYYTAQRYAESLGYKVTLRGIEYVEEPNALTLIDDDEPFLLAVDQIIKFDVIAIVIQEDISQIMPPLISEGFINAIQERITLAQAKKGGGIRLIGINFSLSGEDLEKQQELFGGFFIGKNVTDDELGTDSARKIL